MLPQRQFIIRRQSADEGIALRTDIGRLTQVFINIVSNARKYCDSPVPEVRIGVRRRGGKVTVDFIDNGSGIPKKSQGLIFEKFARLTDTHQAGGAGLGLAICREIMHNLGGDIAYLPGQGGAAFRGGCGGRGRGGGGRTTKWWVGGGRWFLGGGGVGGGLGGGGGQGVEEVRGVGGGEKCERDAGKMEGGRRGVWVGGGAGGGVGGGGGRREGVGGGGVSLGGGGCVGVWVWGAQPALTPHKERQNRASACSTFYRSLK